MKITTLNNAELVIQANVKREADFGKALRVARHMARDSGGDIVVCAYDETEQWIHLTTVWDNYQAAELKTAYNLAKKAA